MYLNRTELPADKWHRRIPLSGELSDLWPSPLPLCTVIPDSTWPLIQPVTVMHGTYQTVPDLWSTPLPLRTLYNRLYLTSDTARYRFARYIAESTWPLIQPVTFMHVTCQTVSEFWSSSLLYKRYIPDSTWPLIQPVTVMHGTYQTVPDLWSRPLPLYTVHNRQYMTSVSARYSYARYITDSNWPLIQPVTVKHGTYQTVLDLWSSQLPYCTAHNKQYLTSDPTRYRYARYIPDSSWALIHPVTVTHGT